MSPHLHVENCEGSGTLPYLKVNNLDCCYSMDVGRRHKTPGQRPRTLLLMAGAVARGLHWFVLVGSQPQCSHQVPQV